MEKCRVCLSLAGLVHIFDPRIKNSQELRNIILVSSGVEINETDIVSKMVCHRCCAIAVNLFKYRTNANEQDKILKEKYGHPLGLHLKESSNTQIISTNNKDNLNNAVLENTSDIKFHLNKNVRTTYGPEFRSAEQNANSEENSQEKHPSIETLIDKYNNIILPEKVYNSDINPVISLDSNEVSTWFIEKRKRLAETLLKLKNSNISIKRLGYIDSDVEEEKFSLSAEFQNFQMYENMNLITIGNETMEDNKYNITLLQNVDNQKRKRSVSRGSSCSESEVIPQKKKRLFQKISTSMGKLDIPENHITDKTTQKAIFTSSLELTPVQISGESLEVENPVVSNRDLVSIGKKDDIFVCTVCNTLCDSKKELHEHQKTHLTCKFCREKIKSLALMKKHMDESCFINIIKNQPFVKLIKIDSLLVKSASEFALQSAYIDEYDDSFTYDDAYAVEDEHSDEVDKKDFIVNSLSGGLLQEMVFIKEQSKVSQGKRDDVVLVLDDSDNDTAEVINNGKGHQKGLQTNNSRINAVNTNTTSQVVTHMEAPMESVSKIHPQIDLNDKKQPSDVSEEEFICKLFKRYAGNKITKDNNSQTFAAVNSSIIYTQNNLIILENMFTELMDYKIPVNLEVKQKISAIFSNVKMAKTTRTVVSWKDKKPCDIRPKILNANLPTYITPKLEESVTQLEEQKVIVQPSSFTPNIEYVQMPLLIPQMDMIPDAAIKQTIQTSFTDLGNEDSSHTNSNNGFIIKPGTLRVKNLSELNETKLQL